MNISDIEYSKLVSRLDFHDTMRNNLLTFSFTAVLTILGIALQMELDVISAWIPLLPFLLIIPFAARISYYRLSSAHIGAFLRVYASDRVRFEIGAKSVHEKIGMGKAYSGVAFLVNHEMVLLGLACCLVFYLKYIPCIDMYQWWHYIGLLIPVVLELIVLIVAHSTNNYSKMVKNFTDAWEKYPLVDKQQ